MKLYIPVSSEQITLKRFVDYQTAADDVERVMVAVNKNRDYCEGLKVETMQTVIELFDAACITGKDTHTPTVTVEGVKLGFIPDINSMTFREHVDLDQLSKSIWLTNGETDYKNLGQSSGRPAFFFEYRRRISEQFIGIFGRDADGGDEGDYTPSGLARWGWYHVLESVAGNDVTKHESVLDMPAASIFTHLSYMRDFQSEQARIIKQSYRK